MTNPGYQKEIGKMLRLLGLSGVVLAITVAIAVILYVDPTYFERQALPEAEVPVAKGTDETGFVEDANKMLVVTNCTACHSAKLVTQNRATRQGWKNMITWMQETQNLWDLGSNEEKILDYLSKHYAPAEQGRRANLKVEEWYELE